MKIKECKIRKVITCDKNDSIVEVAKKLKKNSERHIIITDSKKPLGIISTTDINNRVVAENKDITKTKAKDIMTSKIFEQDVEGDIVKAYLEMIKEKIFSCPVTEKGKLIGVIDLKELMNHVVKLKPKN